MPKLLTAVFIAYFILLFSFLSAYGQEFTTAEYAPTKITRMTALYNIPVNPEDCPQPGIYTGTIVKLLYDEDTATRIMGFTIADKAGARHFFNVDEELYTKSELPMADLGWINTLLKPGRNVKVSSAACGAVGRVMMAKHVIDTNFVKNFPRKGIVAGKNAAPSRNGAIPVANQPAKLSAPLPTSDWEKMPYRKWVYSDVKFPSGLKNGQGKVIRRIYMEKKPVRLSNGNALTWVKTDVLIDISKEKEVTLVEFNCRVNQSRLLSKVLYKGVYIGLPQISYSRITSPVWQQIKPNTVHGFLRRAACQNASGGEDLFPSSGESRQLGIINSDATFVNSDQSPSKLSRNELSKETEQLAEDDSVVLINSVPVDGWYKSISTKSGQEGWISCVDFEVIRNVPEENDSPIIQSGEVSERQPYIIVTNDSNRTMYLKLNDIRYSVAPSKDIRISIPAGRYGYYAVVPKVIPSFGKISIQPGTWYSWKFYIATERR